MPSSGKFQPLIIRLSHFLVTSKHKEKKHRDNNLVVCCSVGSGPSDPRNFGLWNCDEYNPTLLEEQMGAIVKKYNQRSMMGVGGGATETVVGEARRGRGREGRGGGFLFI
ncbi:hypothetical protein J1N35_026815 [Gossypium stocksii]|uniref:Uncharacterized protein n=1 Tax=Gossypium stocksii TaxID=47602 RepID=A0A9D3V8R0_9ROSI|nr:hypothetical protein J1N35_026815 [Gossypium stocksii]